MTDEANAEGKAKALRYYKIMAVMQGILGSVMLICGIVAAVNVDDDIFGPPYFVGGFIVGIMALFSALLCTCVIMKAPSVSSDTSSDTPGDVKKQELRCAMQGHYMLSMFMIMGCFAGTVLCGIGGFAFDRGERSSLNKTLAVVILLGCIIGMIFTVASLCIVCAYGSYFGVVITQQRRGRMALFMTTNNGTTQQFVTTETGPFGTTNTVQFPNVFQSGMGNMGGSGDNTRITELERQNQLLREQLELQAQLNQQQQQQGYSGGFIQPPPSGMYNTGPAYPPTAPPPSYDDVKR